MKKLLQDFTVPSTIVRGKMPVLYKYTVIPIIRNIAPQKINIVTIN